ncbi:MAG: hypothetical protein Q4G03_00305 [Planctomycetia bacterium]|nr:hypothetical protein [Planctomycetia bacterium]
MRREIKSQLELFLCLSMLVMLVIGCATPFFSTDSKLLLYLPGAERRSDTIPGFVRPWERVKLIEEKGKKGQKASPEEKDVLLVQLSEEYDKNISPHIRRSVLEAACRISLNYSSPAAEKLFYDALFSDDLELTLSACHALSVYCTEGAAKGSSRRERRLAAELLHKKYESLPYSIAAGSEEENNRRKDIRVAILRGFGNFEEADAPEVLTTLESGLIGEKLDDGALQTTACASLAQVTHKKYGLNAEAWAQYLAYKRGDADSAPAEDSMTSRLPKLSTETGVFK